MNLKNIFSIGLLACAALTLNAENRWHLADNGGIEWTPKKGETHSDHLEMSGKQVSTVIRYGVNPDGSFKVNKSLVWPMLRTVPNNTHASLMRRYSWDPLDAVVVNGRALTDGEKVKSLNLKGILDVTSDVNMGYLGSWQIDRTYFPSTDKPALVEIYKITNTGKVPLRVEIPEVNQTSPTDPEKGVAGSYAIQSKVNGAGFYTVEPGKSLEFSASISAGVKGKNQPSLDAKAELAAREAFVDEMMNNLVLETPDPVIDRMQAFSKIRGCESIYDTKGGPLHGPGGESYYAAIWANDQAEYINPYFPYVGYEYGNASALNSFLHFARYMNDEGKPIPSSIIAEGDSYWNGAGDRGDAAMIAYGAARYALARGSKAEAVQLWPLITWCLDYCKNKLTKDGVVASDSDELEGRFPAGDANLCTSSLYYDALLSAACLAPEIGKGNGNNYRKQAAELRKNMEKHFGGTVEGFDTYKYYTGNDKLRAWICIPLSVGIDERADATLDALFSPKLWTENGLLTESTDKTFWDRSTLYALRGAYTVGAADRATEFMDKYSNTRLLGDHVPYAIEAWPEGGQRHLSAESGLYGRIITEGLFGIRPTGFRSFTLTPRLPSSWDHMNLRHIKAFGSDFDIEVKREGLDRIKVTVDNNGKKQNFLVKQGKPIQVKL